MIPPPNNDGQRRQSLPAVLQPLRRMGGLTLLIAVGFGYSGLVTWVNWLQAVVAESIRHASASVPYSHPIDGVFGLLFCCAAVVLLWFTFKIPELRRNYWGMGVAWGLILAGWGSLRLLSVVFQLTSYQLTLLVNPVEGSGQVLFAGWLWWFYRADRPLVPQQADDVGAEAEL